QPRRSASKVLNTLRMKYSRSSTSSSDNNLYMYSSGPMSLLQETHELRQRVRQWSGEADTELSRRYALRYPPLRSLGVYRRLRTLVGLLLRRLGLRRSRPLEPWSPALKHLGCSAEASPFVIWALGTDRDTLREACRGFVSLQA